MVLLLPSVSWFRCFWGWDSSDAICVLYASNFPCFELDRHTVQRVENMPLTVSDRIHNSYHTESWEQMSAIKSRILGIWDGAPAPVKLSCIKFAQRVVLAQTASNGMEQKVG